MEKVVVALGGNAILQADQYGTAEEQYNSVHAACAHIVDMLSSGYQVTITHGNGPQVGNLLIQQEEGTREMIPKMPLDLCVAMTQGQIGCMIQQSLTTHIHSRGLSQYQVVTVVTQVLVARDDPAFHNPTKPIGPFYTADQTKIVRQERQYIMTEVKPGYWRRLVPSPQPLSILEREAIRSLIDQGIIVVAAGGGGVPVAMIDGRPVGIEAVIDKDLASQRLAMDIDAEVLLILTDVEQVWLDYHSPKRRPVTRMTTAQAREYLRQGQFPPGSMGPKVEAAVRFVEEGGQRSIITSLDRATEALADKSGTIIAD